MKKILLGGFIFLFAVIAGCSHTNELAKYDIHGKGMLFKDYITSEARQIQIIKGEPQENSENKEDDFLSAIAQIGSDILSADAEENLRKSIHTDDLIHHVTYGLEDALKTYLNTQIVESIDDNPEFIAETKLEHCKLFVSPSGVSINVQAESQIIDRATGAIVWKNWESQTIPIHYDPEGYKEKSKTASKIINAVQISALDEDELNEVVGRAAEDVGMMMGETLREDIQESSGK